MALNDQDPFSTDDDRSDVSVAPITSAGKWLVVLAVSVGIFLLTLSPLLGMAWPYLRAGWSPVRTAWWLRQNDPWPARGKVGFYFHLAMAGFRAGVVGVFMVLVMAIIVAPRQNNVVPTQFIIGICVVMAGVGLSFVFGWWGTILAYRHGVRVFVISNLRERCHADFSQIERVSKLKFMVNPANYVMAVAIVAPLLALWFAAILATMPRPGELRADNTTESLLMMMILPVLAVCCIALLIYLSHRVIAATPHECWGAAIPSGEPPEDNWYQSS